MQENPLDLLVEDQKVNNDILFNATKENTEYEDDILKLVQGKIIYFILTLALWVPQYVTMRLIY